MIEEFMYDDLTTLHLLGSEIIVSLGLIIGLKLKFRYLSY